MESISALLQLLDNIHPMYVVLKDPLLVMNEEGMMQPLSILRASLIKL